MVPMKTLIVGAGLMTVVAAIANTIAGALAHLLAGLP
jgi:hypothetical protein